MQLTRLVDIILHQNRLYTKPKTVMAVIIWLTSLLFAVVHTQYTLTPATLIIFITSMALGLAAQSLQHQRLDYRTFRLQLRSIGAGGARRVVRMIRFLALLPLLLTIQVAGFAHDGAVTIDFPNALHFSVNLTMPPQRITSAQLTLTPQGGSSIVIPVDVTNQSVDVANLQPADKGKAARSDFAWPIPGR